MVSRSRLVVWLILAVVVGAQLRATRLPHDAKPLVPPAIYRTWWAATEACAGLRGSFESITWYAVSGSAFSVSGGSAVGLTRILPWRTDVVLARAHVADELVVRHEMLHALLGRGGHPPVYFEERCHLTPETWMQ